MGKHLTTGILPSNTEEWESPQDFFDKLNRILLYDDDTLEVQNDD